MWNLVGASVTGTSHFKTGLPCQDYCRFDVFTAGGQQCVALALSDGAGSASHSHIGSKIAVDTALGTIATLLQENEIFTEEMAIRVIECAKAEIQECSEKAQLALRNFACTLLFAVLKADVAYFAQLGDGGWVARIGESLIPVIWPFRGEYANETFFLTSSNWKTGFQFESLAMPITAVAGFTDGVQPVALRYDTRSVHEPFFAPLFKVLEGTLDASSLQSPLQGFLDTDSLNERTDDDKTLLLAVRRQLRLLEWTSLTITKT